MPRKVKGKKNIYTRSFSSKELFLGQSSRCQTELTMRLRQEDTQSRRMCPVVVLLWVLSCPSHRKSVLSSINVRIMNEQIKIPRGKSSVACHLIDSRSMFKVLWTKGIHVHSNCSHLAPAIDSQQTSYNRAQTA